MSIEPYKRRCCDSRCDWRGLESNLLTAPDPFTPGNILVACPKCRAQTVRTVCDQPGCWEFDTCVWAFTQGYRRTCGEHWRSDA